VFQGELKKVNEYYMKQRRLFTLSNEGEVRYYKDGRHLMGSFWLTKDSSVTKSSKTAFHVTIPTRSYYMMDDKG